MFYLLYILAIYLFTFCGAITSLIKPIEDKASECFMKEPHVIWEAPLHSSLVAKLKLQNI